MQRMRFTLAARLAMPLLGAIQEPVKIEGGNLRWQPPQPVVPWQGVRAADRYAKTGDPSSR